MHESSKKIGELQESILNEEKHISRIIEAMKKNMELADMIGAETDEQEELHQHLIRTDTAAKLRAAGHGRTDGNAFLHLAGDLQHGQRGNQQHPGLSLQDRAFFIS